MYTNMLFWDAANLSWTIFCCSELCPGACVGVFYQLRHFIFVVCFPARFSICICMSMNMHSHSDITLLYLTCSACVCWCMLLSVYCIHTWIYIMNMLRHTHLSERRCTVCFAGDIQIIYISIFFCHKRSNEIQIQFSYIIIFASCNNPMVISMLCKMHYFNSALANLCACLSYITRCSGDVVCACMLNISIFK